MNYCNIKKNDIANGPGVRIVLFVSGCTHHCKGCFQPETWNFDYGEEFTEEVQDRIIEYMKPSYVDGLTILGGEPFEPVNQRGLIDFVKKVRETYPFKTIWCYSGYTYDVDIVPENGKAHCEVTGDLLENIDVLVDGEFILEKKNLSIVFRGSENQRIIDVGKSLGQNNVEIIPDSTFKGMIQ